MNESVVQRFRPRLSGAKWWRIGVFGGLALALVAVLWLSGTSTTKGEPAVGAVADSGNVVKSGPKRPSAVDAWVKEVLNVNGYSPQDSRKFWTENGGIVVVDLRSLSIWTLPGQGAVQGVEVSFPDSLRLANASICGDLGFEATLWLDRTYPTWRDSQRCAPADIEAKLDAWVLENSGWLREIGKQKDAKGEVVSLSLACLDSKILFDPARSKVDRALQRLELSGCRLSETDPKGGVRSRWGRSRVPLDLRALVFRGGHNPYLDLRFLESLDSLEVEGGDLSLLRLPDGERSMRSIRLSGVSLCDLALVERIRSRGGEVEDLRCPEPVAMRFATVKEIMEEFEQVSWEKGALVVDTTGDQSYGDFIEDTLPSPSVWKGFAVQDRSCPSGPDSSTHLVEAGNDWIQDPGTGDFFFDGFEAISRGRFRKGDAWSSLALSGPRPFAHSPKFLIWADEQDELRLILHFRDDRLDAVWVPSGCWTEGWVGKHRESYRIHLKSE